MYIQTTALRKLLSLKKRIKGIAGGSSASKTISIIQILIDKAQSDKHPKLTSITSESMPHLKRGAMRDFLDILKTQNYYDDNRWNRSDFIYTFETGSKIEFFSLDMPHKVRGPRRDRLFINEANNNSKETFDQLEIRTNDEVWLDWNPTNEFWFYTELKDQENVDFLILTYKDNEGLAPAIIQSIESRRGNKNWWKVYGEGQLGLVEGAIYPHFKPIDDIPEDARLVRKGLDFGYTNDPSAIVAIYQWNNAYIWDELLYRKGMSNKDIADVINNTEKALVIADSAEPKSIDELKLYGVNVLPSQKGQGSVNQGIQFVQDQVIYVTKRSLNIWKEQRNYLWLTDKDGKIINEPSPFLNHCFVGDTEIRTSDSYKPIKDIKKGDWVVTSKGIRPVLKRWNNGTKQVARYSLQFDTFNVILKATPDHKIKTTKGWKKISQLQSGMMVYHNNYLGVKPTISTQKRDTSQEVQSECTQRYGDTTMGQSLKDFMYTTKIKTRGTIDYLTSFLLEAISTSPIMVKGDFQSPWYSLKPSSQKAWKQLKFGTQRGLELNGIGNTLKINGSRIVIQNVSVNSAGNIIKQDTRVYPNIAIQTAKLKRLDVGESWKEKVYDLEVQGCHEYFANTILVHNCMDAGRYGMESLRQIDHEDLMLYGNDYKNINEGLDSKWRL